MAQYIIYVNNFGPAAVPEIRAPLFMIIASYIDFSFRTFVMIKAYRFSA